MARQARKKSNSGIYHIMLRGINKQPIFLDEQDYQKFIKILAFCKEMSEFELYAYCLMDNHIHLLIKETDEGIATIMKRICCRFVYWYNAKYDRVGHLFQDRFKSEPVETDEYLLAAMRYIHQNPVKANLVRHCADYPYSSYNLYFKNSKLINQDVIFHVINQSQFAQFHIIFEERNFVEMPDEKQKKVLPEDAAKLFSEITGCAQPADFEKLEKATKKEYIKKMKACGFTIKQMCELTGLTYARVAAW